MLWQKLIGVASALRDAFFSNVSLLLHADGTNGSTTFTDSSSNNFTVTSVSSAAISTSIYQFGSGSISLNGTSQYLTVPDSSAFDFGSGDWTVECWVRVTSLSTNRAVIFKRVDNLNDERWVGMGIAPNGTVGGLVASSSTAWGVNASTTSTVSLNTWTHLALVRNGSDVSLYVNGTKNTLTTTASFSVYKDTAPVLIGLSGTTGIYPYYFAGNIDEVRITKGVARYTASFTPPSQAFPNQ